MRSLALFGALVGVVAACSGAARAQDVTYPFEADQTASTPAKATKAAKVIKPRPHKPAVETTQSIPLPKTAPKIESKVEAKLDLKSDPMPESKADERDGLNGVSADERAAIGWSVLLDPVTGIKLGLPVKWVPESKQGANGTHWSSRHGDIQVETFRIKTTEPLSALFERMKREPGTRRVETSTLKPDNFVITGLQGLKKFGVRAQLKNGELRGYTVLYDQMMEGIVAPVTAAMANVFSPFPDSGTPIAALTKPVDYGSGIIVSAEGHILTDRKYADNCTVIAASGLGNAERVALDREHGLALLRVYGKRDLKPVSLASDAPSPGDLILVGVPDPHTQDGGRKLGEVKARLTEGNAIRLRDPIPVAGFSGAAALDAKGLVLGMMETRNMQLASADVALPPVRLVPAPAIRSFLAAHNIAAPPAEGDARAAVVRIICVRKK
jgi:hypothetical protein